jgi:hypothetical protein
MTEEFKKLVRDHLSEGADPEPYYNQALYWCSVLHREYLRRIQERPEVETYNVWCDLVRESDL